ADLRPTGVEVRRGPTHDGIGQYLRDVIEESPAPPDNVAKTLRAAGAEIVVSYLPVGSEAASRWYAEQALAAGCAFINCIPVFIAKDAAWRDKFHRRGLPLIGDDIKSQVGATIVHRVLANLFRDRGVRLDRKIGGALIGPSSYYMKSPPEQFTDYQALAKTEAFIRGDAER